MRPCSPLPPTEAGLQLLSWRAIEAKRMGGTENENLIINFIFCGVDVKRIKRTPKLVAVLLEGPDVLAARSEGATLRNGIIEIDGNEVGDLNARGIPSATLNTTVHPINVSVRTSGLSDLFYKGFRFERKLDVSERDSLTAPGDPQLLSGPWMRPLALELVLVYVLGVRLELGPGASALVGRELL
jgi:hypothetical protein